MFQAQKEHVDLGNVLVGNLKDCSMVLLNDGICSLQYILSVEQLITGLCDPEEVCGDPMGTGRNQPEMGPRPSPLFCKVVLARAQRLSCLLANLQLLS